MATTEQKNPVLDGFPIEYENPRKIPRAKFIDDVEQYVKKEAGSVDPAEAVEGIKQKLAEELNKYGVMENRIRASRAHFKRKIPEIKKTLKAVKHLKQEQEAKNTIVTQYQVADNVFMEATLDNSGTVALWLGANVMVEYTLDEALEILSKSLTAAQKNYDNLTEDSAFVKDQITTSEVNISRVHNHGVKLKAQKK